MLSATTTEMITGQKSGEKFHILLKLKMGFFMWEKKRMAVRCCGDIWNILLKLVSLKNMEKYKIKFTLMGTMLKW